MWSSAKKAFTLIELLVVVTLIAILSIVVLSLVNPKEQKDKASDSRVKSTMTEIFKAHLRYSTDNNVYYFENPIVAAKISSPEARRMLSILIDSKELKENIVSDAYLDEITVNSTSLDKLSLCYLPKAKSNQVYSLKTRYDIYGNIRTNCNSKKCYYCLTMSDSGNN